MEHTIQVTVMWKDKDGELHDEVVDDIDDAIELLQNIQGEFDEEDGCY